MLLRYFLYDGEVVPVACVVTVIAFVFAFHTRCFYIVRSLYLNIFSACFLITFLSHEISVPINIIIIIIIILLLNSGTTVDAKKFVRISGSLFVLAVIDSFHLIQ